MRISTDVPPRRLFSVDEYERMVEAAILTTDDKVELIDGEIIVRPPMGTPHAGRTTWLQAVVLQHAGRPGSRADAIPDQAAGLRT